MDWLIDLFIYWLTDWLIELQFEITKTACAGAQTDKYMSEVRMTTR